MNIDDLVRENIRNLIPYTSARSEHSNTTGILLDANENSIGSTVKKGLNRYPDPLQHRLKEKLALQKRINEDQLFLGNGSDEAIDLLIRAFCIPGEDKILITPPTYGIYAVYAEINDIQVLKIPLNEQYDLNIDNIIERIDRNTKLIFFCSPNNPTGNCLNHEAILKILKHFHGITVIDEAYLDFANETTWINSLDQFEKLVVLQTFSKAWGLANIRLGMAFANSHIIQILNRIKYPYNINGLTQHLALQALKNSDKKERMVSQIIEQREYLRSKLYHLPIVKKIYPSQANFLLIKFFSAREVYNYLIKSNIIVRDRSNVILCDNCLRITVGSREENELLIRTLKKMEKKQ